MSFDTFDPFLDPPPPGPIRCEGCGKATVILRLGETAPAVCEVCADYERRKQEERALAGSPYETAMRKNVVLDERWSP